MYCERERERAILKVIDICVRYIFRAIDIRVYIEKEREREILNIWSAKKERDRERIERKRELYMG